MSICTLIPEYLDKTRSGCISPVTYDENQCVFICSQNGNGQNVMRVFTSLVDDNSEHPLSGIERTTPTWREIDVCAVFRNG